MKAWRKARVVIAAALAALFLTGCWDVHDINDNTPIIAMGFDYGSDGMWRVSISEALLAQGGAASYTGAIHYGDGPTLTEAIESLRTHLARRIYLGSTKVYVMGAGVLQDKTVEVLRMLFERSQVDHTSYVIGTHQTALQILSHPDGALGLTGVRLLKEFETEQEARDGHIKEPLWKMVWGVLDPQDTMHISVFDELPQTSVKASGTALISHGQLRTILDREESVTLRWLLGRQGRNVVPLEPPYDQYELKTTSVQTRTRYDGVSQRINVQISAEAEVYLAPSMELPSTLLAGLSQAGADVMVKRLTGLAAKLKSVNADAARWQNVAMQAGYPDFDLQRTAVAVQVTLHMMPHFAPSM